jgi:D-amino-acid dehydrogenase
MSEAVDVVVIGAGIVGACIAHALRARGDRVVLVDRDEPGHGASFGNSGALSPGSVAPLAMPGVLSGVPSMLLDARGPLYLPPEYLPRALPWLARFVAAARPAEVARISQALADLHRGAIDAHLALAAAVGAADLIVRRGHLHLYPDDDSLAKDAAAWRLRAEHGIPAERIERAGIEALEPAVGARYRVGMFLADHATVTDPLGYVQRIVAAFAAAGGRVARDAVVALDPLDGGWTVRGEANSLRAPHVVVSAGAWSARLLAPLGLRLPLETQRGYHARFAGRSTLVSRTVVLADRKAFLAPMRDGLRIGGTVEFGGLAREPDWKRAATLADIARETFPALAGAPVETWMGHRPCFPDTLPRVGPAEDHPGLWLAFGHGHLGLTDSANTARLLAETLPRAGAPAP